MDSRASNDPMIGQPGMGHSGMGQQGLDSGTCGWDSNSRQPEDPKLKQLGRDFMLPLYQCWQYPGTTDCQ
eukprot:3187917-Rhodomonas_salina.2